LVGLFNTPKRRLRKLVQNGDYKEAIELGNSLEDKYATDVDFLFIMGGIYYILEDVQNTLHYIERVLEISESDPDALFLKASVHVYLKETNIARKCCKKILENYPKNADAKEMLDNLDKN